MKFAKIFEKDDDQLIVAKAMIAPGVPGVFVIGPEGVIAMLGSANEKDRDEVFNAIDADKAFAIRDGASTVVETARAIAEKEESENVH